MPTKPLSFATLLPPVVVLLCYAVLMTLAAPVYLDLSRRPVHAGKITLQNSEGSFEVPRAAVARTAVLSASNDASRYVQAVNFPGKATEAAVSGVMRTWPDSWRPVLFGPELRVPALTGFIGMETLETHISKSRCGAPAPAPTPAPTPAPEPAPEPAPTPTPTPELSVGPKQGQGEIRARPR